MTGKTTTTRFRRGTVMTESLLILPLLLLVMSMLFFFGQMAERTQKTLQMSRYETWRQMVRSSGPRSHDWDQTDDVRHAQLNWTFFDNDAERIVHWATDPQGLRYPNQAYEDMIDEAATVSDETGELAEAIVYTPSGEFVRMINGHREGFAVTHPVRLPLYDQLHRPIRRATSRIAHEWRYTTSNDACADTWTGSRDSNDHPRAVRDVFYEEFDDYLDGIDGDRDPEYFYDEQSSQQFSPEILAGFIRSLYLTRPGYNGPIVHDERP